jgi:hypothetical protein
LTKLTASASRRSSLSHLGQQLTLYAAAAAAATVHRSRAVVNQHEQQQQRQRQWQQQQQLREGAAAFQSALPSISGYPFHSIPPSSSSSRSCTSSFFAVLPGTL